MANMIPDILPENIENSGERMFYTAARELPNEYTVLYSYKYQLPYDVRESIREADFVIVHPALGYVVTEVKQGDIAYRDNQWCEFKKSEYQPMHKDPVEQAQQTMYAILDFYKKETNGKDFPLTIRHALCFPECAQIAGIIPKNLKEEGVWTYHDLENLERKILELFGKENAIQTEATKILLNKILAPTFNLFSKLEDKITMFNKSSEKILTEEQERILDETEEDKRKIYLGSAGTGKTFIAMEKARRLAREGKSVFLTCYNKNLVRTFKDLSEFNNIIAKNFHEYIHHIVSQAGYDLTEPENYEEKDRYFKETLPNLAFDHFSGLSEELKFNAIVVDEGQDFKEEWFLCLENMLKKDGQFYIFADLNQDIFGNGLSSLKNIEMSRHKLTLNIRNTEKIAEWFAPYVGNLKTRIKLPGGIPVSVFPWEKQEEEKRLIEKEIGRLVSQGLPPNRITILSPNIKDKSSLSGLKKIKEWPLIDIKEGSGYGIKFATIRSFKGLEADVVFLIGLTENSKVCTPQDIYVGASRARFLLNVFGERDALTIRCQ